MPVSEKGTFMTALVGELDQFDPYDPAFAAEYFDRLAEMRTRCPVAHSDHHGGFWVLTRYDDVRKVILDWESFTSEQGLSIPKTHNALRMPPIEVDPPEQRQWRKLMNHLLTPQILAKHEPGMRRIANELLDPIVERGEGDLAVEFARPYPGTIFFTELLGLPRDELADVLGWTHVVSFEAASPDLPNAFASLFQFCAEVLTKRKEQGVRREDLVDSLVYGDLEGTEPPFERKVAALIMLIIGGLDTSANLIGNIMNQLARDSALRDQFRDDPQLWREALEEFLRFEGPISGLARTATRDVEIGGKLIRAGDVVLCHYGAANRDPEQFDDPDVLNFGRETNRHIAFGLGVHRCAGSNLARIQIRIALEEILRRMPDIRLKPGADVQWVRGMAHGVSSLPVVFTPTP